MRVWTGASTGPELDGALAKADGIEFRLPYNSDPVARERINRGEMEYFDMHLSQVAPMAWQGFLGKLDVGVIEVAGHPRGRRLIPSSSVGNNKTWLDRADRIILEVNRWQNPALEGMHDIYYGTALPPNRKPIPLVRPDDRIGETCFRCDPGQGGRRSSRPTRPTATCRSPPPDAAAPGHRRPLLEFFGHEVKRGRLPPNAAAAAVGRGQHRQRGAGRPAARAPSRT